jgi:hypothetical protein
MGTWVCAQELDGEGMAYEREAPTVAGDGCGGGSYRDMDGTEHCGHRDRCRRLVEL